MKKTIDALVDYLSGSGPLFLLESQTKNHRASRYSYIAAQPEAAIKAAGRQITIIESGKSSQYEGNPWKALARFKEKQDDYLFGYLGYDLKNHLEQLTSTNRDKIGAPDLFFIVPSAVLKIDHQAKNIEAVKGEMPNVEFEMEEPEKVDITDPYSSVSREEYIGKVKNIKRDIYEGAYYELNFTHQLESRFAGRPYDLYRKMRRQGPVPFGAYLAMDDMDICCASPERFLCKKGDRVFSQPIKGTIKRSVDAGKDEVMKDKLKSSAKERSENLMTVDLVRNDLSRIARRDSVKVENLCEIQSFSTVHQMVSTVEAVSAKSSPVEIIRACFPMGSMTGAPKVNVMKRIEELENYRRGIYSGAVGYIAPNDDFDFNVVIRTAILKQNKLFYPVGGAITADSDPRSEWEETWLKAEALKEGAS